MSYVQEFGFEELEAMFTRNLENFPEWKKKELYRLGRILQDDVKKYTPVDTSNLVQNIEMEVQDGNSVMVGTNVEYAEAVEKGHIQHRRFLPAKYLSSVRGRQYLGNNQNGIMLKERFVEGSHMFQRALQEYPNKATEEVEGFTKAMFRLLL